MMPGRVSWVLPAALIAVAALNVFSQAPGDTDRERAYRANNVGVALLEQFDYEAAARSFREALKLHSSLDLARLNLAIALFYGGHPAEAAAEVRTAV
jgi:lipoprotein NlpI